MNRLMIYFFTTLALMFAAGCNDSPDTEGPSTTEPDIVFDGEVPTPVLTADGTAVTIRFTATAEWSATRNSDAEWLSISPNAGDAGNVEMVLTAEPNEEYDERNTMISIASGNVKKAIRVTQKQRNALLLTSNTVDVSYEGALLNFEYQTNAGEVEVEVETSAQSWIKRSAASESSRALESGTFTLQVEANTTKNNRTGKVTLRAGEISETLTVNQIGLVPGLIVAQTEYKVPAAGGALRIEVQDNVGEVPAAVCSADWIKNATGTRGMSVYAFDFTVDENTEATQRTATIEFTVQNGSLKESVTVTQSAKGAADALFMWPNNEAADGIQRAFPGAEGGGMYTEGGRGGRVIHVTNLNDSGAGSLREALEVNEPRTIVFDVSGDIILKSDLKIGKNNVTIAGQTAPGDGICIRGGTVYIGANHVIIRYLRFRLGDESKFLSDGSDAIWGRYQQDIILDHCSMSWSVDEVASFYANKNFTMQWCIVAEAMANSVHGKGGHGYGGIWGGRNASFHHNMLAHNNSRNARIDHPQIYGNYLSTNRGNVDFRNNVIYNWGDNNTYGGEGGWFNFVGNYYKPGPASKDRKYFIDANGYYESGKTQYDYPRLYLEGNVHTKYPEFTADQTKGVFLHDMTSHPGEGNPGTMYLTSPLPISKDDQTVCWTTTHSAQGAYESVLAYAGASLRRDAVDAHVVYDARNGVATYMLGSNGSKNGIIDSQKDVGGWPVLTASQAETARVKDTDGDGIPDYYEELFGLDPANGSDGNEYTFDSRYTNLEMYLHYLVQHIVAAQVADGVNTELK